MDGTALQSVAISGDATLAASGALTVTKTNGKAFVASTTGHHGRHQHHLRARCRQHGCPIPA
jgi:hypothetical protein